jgi:hypothetical protein
MEGVMRILMGALLVAVEFGIVLVALAWTNRRTRRRDEVTARQIRVTDAIHARFGAVAAPVVTRSNHGWRVRIAVPREHRALATQLLGHVFATFRPPDGAREPFEIVLTVSPDGATPTLTTVTGTARAA